VAATHFLLGFLMEQWIAWHYSLGFCLMMKAWLSLSLIEVSACCLALLSIQNKAP
jgi:hypothetical protein